MGLPEPGAAGTASGRAGMRQRTQTSAPRHFWSAAPGRRVSPHRTLAASARPLVRSLARRAHTGRTPPHTHTRCTLPASPAPPLCQEAAGSCTLRGPHPGLQTPVCHPHWESGTGPPRSRWPPRLQCQPPSRPARPGLPCAAHTHIHRSPSRDTRRGGRGGAVPGAGTVAR